MKRVEEKCAQEIAVYLKNQEAYDKLCELRARAKRFLESEARILRANELIDKAKTSYANACLREGLGEARLNACDVISYLSDAVMIYHGTYFKRGTKRTFEELATLPLDEVFMQMIQNNWCVLSGFFLS